jgi:hypothetical protein
MNLFKRNHEATIPDEQECAICIGLTPRMSYRRRETPDASIADPLSKTERLAAVSSIR